MNGKRQRSFGSAWMHMVRLVAVTMVVVLLAAFLIFQYSNYEEQKHNQQLKESILNEQ